MKGFFTNLLVLVSITLLVSTGLYLGYRYLKASVKKPVTPRVLSVGESMMADEPGYIPHGKTYTTAAKVDPDLYENMKLNEANTVAGDKKMHVIADLNGDPECEAAQAAMDAVERAKVEPCQEPVYRDVIPPEKTKYFPYNGIPKVNPLTKEVH